MPFQEFLSSDRILFLPPSSKEKALSLLVDHLTHQNLLSDSKLFYEELLKREKLMPTTIGLGAALPHAKLASLDKFFLCIGIVKEGIDWSPDEDIPVKFIFLIGGPDNKPIEYLSLLSSLTKTIRKEKILKKLSKATTAEAALSALL